MIILLKILMCLIFFTNVLFLKNEWPFLNHCELLDIPDMYCEYKPTVKLDTLVCFLIFSDVAVSMTVMVTVFDVSVLNMSDLKDIIWFRQGLVHYFRKWKTIWPNKDAVLGLIVAIDICLIIRQMSIATRLILIISY